MPNRPFAVEFSAILILASMALVSVTPPSAFAAFSEASTPVKAASPPRIGPSWDVTVCWATALCQSGPPLPPDYYAHFPTEANGGNTRLKFTLNASASLDLFVMDQLQYSDFHALGEEAYIYHSNATYVSTEVVLPQEGMYYIVALNDLSKKDLSLTLTYWTVPVDIHQGYSMPPAPVGLADYGVVNSGGNMLAYSERLSAVSGTALVREASAYNASAVNPYGLGLQLNAVLRINTTSGQYVYWLQNVLQLYTDSHMAQFEDNIHNFTGPGSQLNPSSISGGGIVPAGDRYYAAETVPFKYTLPEMFGMATAVSAVTPSPNRVDVAFAFSNSSITQSSVTVTGVVYDVVEISEPQTVTDAAIIVSGEEPAPNGAFYDVEFAFSGTPGGTATTVTNMTSTLSLSYNLPDGTPAEPRSLYMFGSDTAETVYNLQVAWADSGFQVGLGKTDFGMDFTTPVAVTCKPSSDSIGTATTCTAKVTGTSPTGTVTFSSDSTGVFTTVKGKGASNSITCKLVKGSCSVKYKPTSLTSPATITASYSGDSGNLPGYSASSLPISIKTSKTTVSCKPASVVAGSSTTIKCTARVIGYSPAGNVTWSSTGTGAISLHQGETCTLTKGSCAVTFTGTTSGTVAVQAAYGGDPNNTDSTGTHKLTLK